MSERTERDDTVDEAIEVLIDDSTDAFVLMGRQGRETHFLEACEKPGDRLLAVWLLVSRIMQVSKEAGVSLEPTDVLAAAYQEAESRGYLHGSLEESR